MKSYGIKSIIRRKKPGYIKSTPDYIAENILDRNFSASKPNEIWLSDVTEFKATNGRKLYLCAIMDLFDNSVVAYTLSTTPNNEQLYKTFKKALKLNPNATPLFHSDRGYQYTSIQFKKMLEEQGITHSMSRVGKCIDNGPIENLWELLKKERFKINKFINKMKKEKEVKNKMNFKIILRLQSKLKSQTPMEYRNLAI